MKQKKHCQAIVCTDNEAMWYSDIVETECWLHYCLE